MGTAIGVELWCDQRAAGEAAITAVMDEMHRIDRTMSPHKADSELSRINRGAGAGPVPVSAEMARLIVRAAEFSALSGGAFDITYAAVGQLYDYRNRVRPERRRARRGARRRRLAPPRPRQPGRDRALRSRRACGSTSAASPRAMRSTTRRRSCAGAASPTRWSAPAATAASSATGAAGRGRSAFATRAGPARSRRCCRSRTSRSRPRATTSAISTREGTRFHHLIDPATGKSPREIQSVTILADDGLTCEALSKIVFVLGVERGMALVESQSGVDAVVVDAAGALHFSSGLLAPPPPSSASTTQ